MKKSLFYIVILPCSLFVSCDNNKETTQRSVQTEFAEVEEIPVEIPEVETNSEDNIDFNTSKINEIEQAESRTNAPMTWQERSQEIAGNGRILGVYSYGRTEYVMIYKDGSKYYLHEFDICSSKNSRDELISIAKNKFKYKNGGYDDVLVVSGNQLVTYMPDPFEPSQMYEAEAWDKAN